MRQQVNGKWSNTEYSSVQAAYSTLSDCDNNSANGLNFNGRIVAVLDSNGVAQWVFFYDYNPVGSGNDPDYGTDGQARILNLTYDGTAHSFNATAATRNNVTATTWTMSVYQDGILIARSANVTSGNWTANTAYPVHAAQSIVTPVSGTYEVVLTIYNGANPVASGNATFTID